MVARTITARITSLRDLAPEVREITLAYPGPHHSFQPGQWISVSLPVGDHPPLVRAYSLAAPPSANGEMVLGFDRVPDGLASQYLFDLREGDTLEFSPALGNFLLPEGDQPLLMLAWFIGIVPFRCMLLKLRDANPLRTVHLVYGGPDDSLPYLDDLRLLQQNGNWFHLHLIGSDRDLYPATIEKVEELLAGCSDLIPMICGKREFVKPLREYFYGRGYPRRAVKWESFD